MIKVFDNFLGKNLNEYIQWILPGLNYTPHGSAGRLNFLNTPGVYPDNKVFEYIALLIKNINVINVNSFLRAYINLHPAGEYSAGDWHRDDGDITALYYPMHWQPDYKGSTEFANGEVIDYVTDRLILFNAQMQHRALPHYNSYTFRYTVAYKINATWNNYENSASN